MRENGRVRKMPDRKRKKRIGKGRVRVGLSLDQAKDYPSLAQKLNGF